MSCNARENWRIHKRHVFCPFIGVYISNWGEVCFFFFSRNDFWGMKTADCYFTPDGAFFNYSNDTVLLFSCPVYLTSRVRSKSVSGNFKQPQCGHPVLFRLIRLIRCWTTPETIWQTWVMRMGVSNFIVFFHFSSDLHSRFSFFSSLLRSCIFENFACHAKRCSSSKHVLCKPRMVRGYWCYFVNSHAWKSCESSAAKNDVSVCFFYSKTLNLFWWVFFVSFFVVMVLIQRRLRGKLILMIHAGLNSTIAAAWSMARVRHFLAFHRVRWLLPCRSFCGWLIDTWLL